MTKRFFIDLPSEGVSELTFSIHANLQLIYDIMRIRLVSQTWCFVTRTMHGYMAVSKARSSSATLQSMGSAMLMKPPFTNHTTAPLPLLQCPPFAATPPPPPDLPPPAPLAPLRLPWKPEGE
jgi:hypothetical protein